MELDFEFWDRREASALLLQKQIIRAEERAKGHPEYPVVCRYWLDGNCSAADRCFYLHVYDLNKVPLCAFINMPMCPEGIMCKFRHYYHPHEQDAKSRTDPKRSFAMAEK